jgi:hypothetical protein
MASQPLDEVAPADDDAGLWAPEQLVAREAHESCAGREALARLRLVAERNERTGAEVVNERKVVRSGNLSELCEGWPVGEAEHAEVRLVHAEKNSGVGAGRPLVVGRARSVRRPHLDEAGSRSRQHLGDAEPVADLDQLAARHEHVTAFRERHQRQQHRSRVVVDH